MGGTFLFRQMVHFYSAVYTLSDFAEYKAEIQVRTIAQHIWAAAEHTLQYKQEDNVPKTIRRSIYRVSALLETVDLEFERVLSEREHYIKELKPETQDETLNVDLLKEILDAHLPFENRDDEDYSVLIRNLSNCGINKSSELISLISENLKTVLEIDAMKAEIVRKGSEGSGSEGSESLYKSLYNKSEINRASRGIFYNHTDLIRMMLSKKFGNRWKFSEVKGKLTVIPKNNNENKPSNQ